ncbi:MAG: phenylalanine--tRNA ligase subunit beta, partial [bacterium]
IPKRIFKEFERIPTSRRDVSFVVDKSTPASNILRAIKGVSEYIVDVVLFDLFEGKQIPQGKRNLTLAIEYQCPRRTLTDDEINSIHQKVIELLRTRFGALVRGIDL